MEGTASEMSKEILQTIHEEICNGNESLTALCELWAYWRKTHSGELRQDLINVCSMGQQIADTIFAKFIKALKVPGEREFEIDQISGVMYWLKFYYCKFLSHTPEPSITKAGFDRTNNEFDEKKKIVTRIRKFPNHITSEILAELEFRLWNEKIFVWGAESLERLQDVVFFYFVKIFGMLVGSCLCHLKTKHIVFGDDIHGQYVEITREFEKEYMKENGDRLGPMEEESSGLMLNVIGEMKFRHYNNPNNPCSFYILFLKYTNLLKAQGIEHIFIDTDPSRNGEPWENTNEKCEGKPSAMTASQIDNLFNKIVKKAGDKFSFITHDNVHQLVDAKLATCSLRMQKRSGNNIVRHLEIGKVLDPPSIEELQVVRLASILKLQENGKLDDDDEELSDTGLVKSTLSFRRNSVKFFFKYHCLLSKNWVHLYSLKAGTKEMEKTDDCCENEKSLISEKGKNAYSLLLDMQRIEMKRTNHQMIAKKVNEKLKGTVGVQPPGRPITKSKLLAVEIHQNQSVRSNLKQKIISASLEHSPSGQHNNKDNITSVLLKQSQSSQDKTKQIIKVPLMLGQSEQSDTKQKLISVKLPQNSSPQDNIKQKVVTVPVHCSKSVHHYNKGKNIAMPSQNQANHGPTIAKTIVLQDFKHSTKRVYKNQSDSCKSINSEMSQVKYRKPNPESGSNKRIIDRTMGMSTTISNTVTSNQTEDIQTKQLESHLLCGGDLTDSKQQCNEIDLTEVEQTGDVVVKNENENTRSNQQENMDDEKMSNESSLVHSNVAERDKLLGNGSSSDNHNSSNTLTMEYDISNEKGQSQTLSIKDESNDCLLSFPPNFTIGKLKDVSDLDINLGNYLPENVLIKPSDITLKRVVTPDGGKLQISLKYKSC